MLETIIVNNEHKIKDPYTGNGIVTVDGIVYTGNIQDIVADVNKYIEVYDKPVLKPDGSATKLEDGDLLLANNGEPLLDQDGRMYRGSMGRIVKGPGTPVLIDDPKITVSPDGDITYKYDTGFIDQNEYREYADITGLLLDANGINVKKDNGTVIYSKKKVYVPTIIGIQEPEEDIVETPLYPIHAKVKYTQNKKGQRTMSLERYSVLYEAVISDTQTEVKSVTDSTIIQPGIDYYITMKEAPFIDFKMQYSRMDLELLHIPDTVTDLGKMLNYSNLSLHSRISFENLTVTNDLFSNCTNRTFPPINTINSKNFTQMYNNCEELTEVPPGLNTSKGLRFFGMFKNNQKLIEIPVLDTSKGDNFTYMVYNSPKLTKIAKLDTSKINAVKTDMFGKTPVLVEPNLSEQSDLADVNGKNYTS